MNDLKLKTAVASALLVAAAGMAHAADDEALTWKGITLYGVVDIGLQYQTHGAPINDYFPAGSADIVQKNSNKSTFGATPSNMSQSRVGLQGKEPLVGDWSAVFKLETFFNPQSGNISDGLKSVAQNNGRSLANQTTNIDTSVAGQAFEQAFAGFSSPTYGTLTFGRQNTILADGVAKYDPNYVSQAFSVIGLSGVTAGGGDTQNRRLDSSLKYAVNIASAMHAGLQYKFNGTNGGAKSTTFEAQLGGEYLGFSADAYYVRAHDAITIGPLTSAQVAQLPTLGYSVSNSLFGTISDNSAYSIMGSYAFQVPVKVFAGYEHIQYANPKTPVPAGSDDIGGYVLAFVNNTAFPNDKVLQVYWAGARYSVLPKLDLVAAYYGYHQNAFGAGATAGCSTNVAATCSGTLQAYSFDADYYVTKRFDVYAGIMYTGVQNGLANGYLHTTDMNPTAGVRYKF